MEKRILEAIEKGDESAADKLRLIMRAARVHFSTIDALFHRFLSTEAYVPQVADEHEKAIITAIADERFFQHPRILADIESIVIAARILHMQPEDLVEALDKGKEALEAWDCPESQLDALKAEQARLTAEYEGLRAQVQAVAGATRGALATQVAAPLGEPLAAVDLKRGPLPQSGRGGGQGGRGRPRNARLRCPAGTLSRHAASRRPAPHQHQAAAERPAQALPRPAQRGG